MITINANNATLRENEQSLCALCCLAAVRFNGIVQVGKGLKAHESNGFAMAGGGSGGKRSPSRVAQCMQSLSVCITSVPCSAATFRAPSCPSPDVCGRLSLRKPRAAAADGQEQLVNFIGLPGKDTLMQVFGNSLVLWCKFR